MTDTDAHVGERGPLTERADLPSADQLEAVFFAALEAKDFEGVLAAIQVMIPIDPHRASRLYENLTTAVDLAKTLDRIANQANLERERDEAELNGSMDRGTDD